MKKIVFIGSKEIGLRIAKKILAIDTCHFLGIITLDDRTDSRNKFQELQSLSLDNGLKFSVAKNRAHFSTLIGELQPDLCFVVGWYWLIPEATIELVPHGFIGIHYSLLPKLRGGSPLPWSIILGHKEVGFTVFNIGKGTDDGPVWYQGKMDLGETTFLKEVLFKLNEMVVASFTKVFNGILSGALKPYEQVHDNATYCAQRLPQDGLIDWSKPAKEVFNFIRGQSEPYPGAFFIYLETICHITKARLFEQPFYGTPGQIAKISNEEVYVICGDNKAVILQEIERSAVRQSASSVLNTIKIRL